MGMRSGGLGLGRPWVWWATAPSPEAFVDPKSGDAGLGIMEIFVGPQHALNTWERGVASGMEGGKRVPPEVLAEVAFQDGVIWGVWDAPTLRGSLLRRGEYLQGGCAWPRGRVRWSFTLSVSKVEEVVDLGWWAGSVAPQCCTRPGWPQSPHSQWASPLLKVLELLVDHGAKYPDDLGLLETGPQTQFRSSWPF